MIVRHTGNFKNIILSLATKHQLMIAHYFYSRTHLPALSVTSVPLDVLHANVPLSVRSLYLGQFHVQLANTVTFQRTRYSKGMIVAYGCTAGFPDFVEIMRVQL